MTRTKKGSALLSGTLQTGEEKRGGQATDLWIPLCLEPTVKDPRHQSPQPRVVPVPLCELAGVQLGRDRCREERVQLVRGGFVVAGQLHVHTSRGGGEGRQ